MKTCVRIAVIGLAVVLLGAPTVSAVGYEPVEVSKSCTAPAASNGYTFANAYRALKDATFIEKYPAALDKAAMTVKTVLSQFGIVGFRDASRRR